MMSVSGRQVTAALLCSILLHLLGLFLVQRSSRDLSRSRRLRTRFWLQPRMRPQRFAPRSAISIPGSSLERLRSEAFSTPDAQDNLDLLTAESGRWSRYPPLELATAAVGPEAAGWPRENDRIDVHLDSIDRHREPTAPDLLELDAFGMHRTVALIDPESGRLKQAYLHLPEYLKSYTHEGLGAPEEWPMRGAPEEYGNIEADAHELIQLPLVRHIHYFRLGRPADRWIPTKKEPLPDPIHSFPLFYTRHRLSYQETRNYPFLILRRIDVASTEVMVRYLIEGGTAWVSGVQLAHLRRELERELDQRLQAVRVGLEHPLFRAPFQVKSYQRGNRFCRGFGPLSGLTIDDRLAVLTGVPRFDRDARSCPSNRLHVNALVYCLVQSALAGGMLSSDY